MRILRLLSLFAIISLTGSLVQAQESPLFERVLLPITVRNVPGAFGTLWNTDIWTRITATSPTFVIMPIFPLLDCEPPCNTDGFGPLAAPSSYPIDFYHTHAGDTPGQIIYVSQADADDVHFSIRLSNGRAGAIPVQLPAVRERSFTNRTLHVLGIPSTSTAPRALLRVYGIDPSLLGSVHIKAFDEDWPTNPNSVAFETDVQLQASPQIILPNLIGTYPVRPPVAELSLNSLVPANMPQIRLEITPNDPALRLWAFVSLTDNSTQQVSLRFPD